MTVTLIGATKSSPPAGVEAISWVLLTNLIVKDFVSATKKVRWYGRRWGIEIWHPLYGRQCQVLKSGCKVEDCLLEEACRLKRYLTLFSIIGVRLMHVTTLARAYPDRPATEVFSGEEIEALHIRVTRALPPPRGSRPDAARDGAHARPPRRTLGAQGGW